MSSVVISGDTSGAITLAAPSVAGTNTLTLPASTGTVALTSQVLGVGQTWTDVTSSRALGTTYTNSTGRPITIAIAQNSTSSGGFGGAIVINGASLPQNYSYASTAGYLNWLTYIVPAGATYSCSSNATSLNSWYELR